MKSVKIILLFVFFAGYSMSSFGWGLTGHRIVAKIAENHLNDKARAELFNIIGNEKIEYWANWPDFIRSDTSGRWNETFRWHYVNIDANKDFEQFKESLIAQEATNVYTQIKFLSAKLKDKTISNEEKKTALIFLIHLVGDLHQPLHTGRFQDLGGNRIKVTFFDKEVNLHSLWDDYLVDFQKYSYSEYARILDIKNEAEVAEIQQGSLENWLFESYQLAGQVYAHTAENVVLSYAYNYQFVNLMEKQLLNAGLRLAGILNEVLG